MPQKEGVPESQLNVRVMKYLMFFTAILLYGVCGLFHQQTFPWFVGDAFGTVKLNMNLYDAFEILLIFGWLIVFTGHAYLIYIDSNCTLWYPIAYIVGYYQFILCVSAKAYFENVDHAMFKYINYGSALFCIVLNAIIFSLNKYVLPQTNSHCVNTLMVHLLIFVFLILFLYESIFGSIYGDKMCSKVFQLFLFFGHYFLILIYTKEKEEDEDDESDTDELAGEHEPMNCKMKEHIHMNQQAPPPWQQQQQQQQQHQQQRYFYQPGADEYEIPYHYDAEQVSFII